MSGISDPCSHVRSRTSADPDVIYVGYRRRGRAIVKNQSDQEQLTPERSLALASHSPSGFEWGYGGGGRQCHPRPPARLHLDDEEVALASNKAFKTEVVSQLECTGPDGCWRLTGYEIDATLREIVDDPSHRPSTNDHERAINVRPPSSSLVRAQNRRRTVSVRHQPRYVERDVGVSLTVKLTRGTGTRSRQDHGQSEG